VSIWLSAEPLTPEGTALADFTTASNGADVIRGRLTFRP
jgi:hypothetical protein